MSTPSYWLIGVPNENKGDEATTRNSLMQKARGMASVFAFQIPSLKVGTLDSLYTLSDDLGKLDQFVEATAKKLEKALFDVYKADIKTDEDAKKTQTPKLEISTEDRQKTMTPEQYLENFKWDEQRYSKRKPIVDLSQTIVKEVSRVDDELKQSLTEFNELKTNVMAQKRRDEGSLLVQHLGRYVKKMIWLKPSISLLC